MSDIIKQIKEEMKSSSDMIYREMKIHDKKCYIVFLNGMIDKDMLAKTVIEPIHGLQKPITLDKVQNALLASEIKLLSEIKNIVEAIVNNNVLVIIDGETNAIAINLEKYLKRVPSEPPTSSVIQGPRAGFTEDLDTNISLLRRRFPTSKFKIKSLYIGRYTQTQVAICYIDGIADKKVIATIKKRLESIDIDGVIDSYYLVGFLQERKASLFKQVGSVEKPDIVASKILEGRVAILCDGSPIALTLPFLYIEDIQNSNDYYTNIHYSTFIRIIRTIGILISTVAPGIYLSIRLYHYKVVPLRYIITISNSSENLPFTPFIEILFILILFQILYEVSLRLPQYLGLATSVVGALILGDTGVKAGLISPPTVIIIALSLIAIYTVPEQAPQFTVLRFLFILIGGALGILGISAMCVYIINYCNTLNSYGAPYLAPYSPRVSNDLKDAIIIKSMADMTTRPESYKVDNKVRARK